FDRIAADAPLGKGQALAGGDVVLERVPGTGNDLCVEGPLKLPLVSGVRDERAGDAAGTERARLVNADIGKRVVLAVHVKDADLAFANLHNQALAFGNIAQPGDDVLTGHGR